MRIAIYLQKFAMILLFIVRSIILKKSAVDLHTSDCTIRSTQEKCTSKRVLIKVIYYHNNNDTKKNPVHQQRTSLLIVHMLYVGY